MNIFFTRNKKELAVALITIVSFFGVINCRKADAQSKMWATSSSGGSGFGTIVSIKPGSSSVSDVVNLNGTPGSLPEYSSLVQTSDGKLWGITFSGGANGGGVIFQYDPVSNTYTKKVDMASAGGYYSAGGLTLASDGNLYGMTYSGGANSVGAIFQYNPSSNIYTKKIDFTPANGSNPLGSMMQANDGKLYGMTYSGGNYFVGVIFQYDPVSNIYTKKYDLSNASGCNPHGTLLQANDGTLYGMTTQGGDSTDGVLFQYDPVSNNFFKKFSFYPASGYYPLGSLIQTSDGKMYGLTALGGVGQVGVIFQYDPVANAYTNKFNLFPGYGCNPYGSFIQASDSKLYAMTNNGGANSAGVIFQYDPSSNTFTKKIDLTVVGGERPYGSLMQAIDGKIYGTTTYGGGANSGVIFQYDQVANIYTKKVDFYAANGDYPSGNLTKANDGKTYGMTYDGGLNSEGVLFQFDPTTNTYIKKVDLGDSIGYNPYGSLVQASDGNLYGLTTYGGANELGVIFKYTPSTSTYTKLLDLTSGTGYYPSGSLMQATDGKLYGMTTYGGLNDYGVIFSWDPGQNKYLDVIDLDSSSANPYGSLIQASDGKLYGMTSDGGVNSAGIIFQLSLNGNKFAKKIDLSSANGDYPYGSLVQASDGNIYGMTFQGGVNDAGVIFQYNPVTNTYTKKIDLTAANGSGPNGSLMQASDGKLYGTTSLGGANGIGVIFQYNYTTNTYTKLIDFNNVNGNTPLADLVEISCSPPSAAGAISGSTLVCAGATTTYSISAVPGASGYTWTVPSGATINSGQNTTGINLTLGTTSGTVSVVPNNTCGTSASSSLSITINAVPTVGSTSSPAASVCSGYSVTLSGTGATAYSWSGGVTNGVSFVPASTTTYTVTGTGANGCTNTNTITITIKSLPTVGSTASPSAVICAGSTVTLNGTGASSYTWSGGVTNGVSFIPSSTGTYTVSGTGANGCSSSNAIMVTVNPLPSVGSIASPSSAICSGSSVTLSGTGAITYSWSGGVTNGVSFVPASTATYTVTGTTNGCSNTGTLAVTVNPLPAVGTAASPSSAVCLGSSVTLNGTGATSYIWSGGITNGVSFVPAATATYTVTGTSANGCSNTNTITVSVNLLPTVGSTASPSSTICTGSAVTLSGTGATSYSWTGGVTNGVPFTPSQTSTYTVTGTTSRCSNTSAITITVNAVPTVGYIVSPSTTVCSGTSVTLNGTGASSYAWSGGVTDGVSFIPSATNTYTVTGTTSGCSNTSAVTVTITVNPSPTVAFIATPSSTVCSGSSITLSGTGANSYSWSGGVTDGDSFVPASTATYTVTGTGSNGCTNTNTISIMVNAIPTVGITVSPFSSLCSGSSVTLTGTGATSYSWSGGVNNGVPFVPLFTTTYTVTGTDANGCTNSASKKVTVNTSPAVGATASPSATVCSGTSVTLSGTGATSYSWSGGVTNGVSFVPSSTTSFTVTGTDANGCTNSSTITITVNQSPTVGSTSSPSASVCSGSSVTLSGTGATSYSWSGGVTNGISFVPASTATYTVTGTGAGGCTNTNTVTITVNLIPTVGATASPSSTVCSGSSVTLNGTGATSYSWSGGVTNGISFVPSSTATYTVAGTGANGCTGTNTKTITVNSLPIVGITASPSPIICSGSSVTLSGTGAASYAWSGGVTNGVSFVPASTATYTVTGTGANGCAGTKTITVTVNQLPAVGYTASPSATVCSGSSVTLSGTGATTYSWSGGISNGVSFIPFSVTTYTVTGTSASGCTNTNTVTVTAIALPTVGSTASPSSTVCSGTSVTLNGTGATTYTWSGGVTNGVSFTPASTTTYTVTGTGAGGCTNTNTKTITVNPTPSVGATASPSSSICTGSSVILSGTGATSYSWSGSVTDGVSFVPSSTTTYTVTGTGANGCTNTKTLTITVNPYPTVGAFASPSSSICSGSSVTLSGTGATSYSWSGGVTNGVSFSPSSTATYTVTGTSNGCSSTGTLTATVNPLPTVGSAATPSSIICSGSSVTLTGTGASSYSWSGGVTDGVSFIPSSTTTYTVTGTTNGCSNTNTITITVNSVLAMPGAIIGPTAICSGSSAAYSVSAVTGALTYIWTLPSGWTGSSLTDSINITSSVTGGTISVTANNTCGSSAPQTLNVSIKSLPAVGATASPSTPICSGSSVTLNGTGATGYSWSDGVTDGVPFVIYSTSTYTVTGTGVNGCTSTNTKTVAVNPLPPVGATALPSADVCAGTSVTLSGSGATTYSWTGGITDGASFIPDSTTAYIVTGTDANGCMNSDTVIVKVNSTIAIPGAISGPATICSGASATYSVAHVNGVSSYTWTLPSGWTGASTVDSINVIASTTGGTISVNAVNGCGNSSAQTLNVSVNLSPSVGATASPSSPVCSGSSVTLSGTGATSYSWSGGVNNGISFVPASSNTYTVIGTAANGCTNTNTKTITVDTLPIIGVAASPSSAVCSGSTVTLSGTGATSYSWSGGVNNGISFVPASTNTYTVTGTAANGCTNTNTKTITVNPPPAVGATAFPSSAVCSGSSVTLSGTGAASYSWSGGVTNGVAFVPASTATYTVTGTDANGCTNTNTKTVTVNPLPAVGASASPSSSICSGASLTLNGTGATSYIWSGGVTNGTPFVPPSTATYTVTGTTNGCSATNTITVTVNALPTIGVIASPSSTVCAGASVTLSGTGASSYSWSGGVTDGISFVPPSTATYTVTGTDANGCSASGTKTITVNSLPTVGAVATPSSVVCSGSSVTLNGTGASFYSWSGGVINGVSFIPASTSTFTVTGTTAACSNTATITITVNTVLIVGATATPSSTICSGSSVTLNGTGAGSYTWSGGVTNGVPFVPASTGTYIVTGAASGCSSTGTITITVNPLPTIGVNVSPSATVCAGSSVTLSGTGADVYSWSGGVTNGVAFILSSSATYTVTGTDANGCSNTNTITLTANSSPTVSASAVPSAIVCAGSTVTLSGSGATTYSWSGGVTDGIAFVPSGITTYTVTGTGSNGCTNTNTIVVTSNPLPTVTATVSASSTTCLGSSLTLNGKGASTYSWSDGVTDGVSFVPSSTSTYTVTGTDINGCSNTGTITITVNMPPAIEIIASPSSTVCSGSAVTLSGTGASTYIWSGGVTDGTSFILSSTTTFTVTGTDVNGCTNTDTITVTANPSPATGAMALPSSTVCSGSSLTLNGTGASSYSWSGGVTDGVSFVPSSIVTYTVTGTGANGCTNTNTITITVNPIPNVGATALPAEAVCAGSSVTLSGTGASTYSWSGGVMDGVAFVPSATNTYTVTGTMNGCSNTSTLTLTVNLLPIVNVIASPSSTICAGSSLTLSGTGASSYGWSGGINNGISFAPSSSDTYTVTGTDANGCTNTNTVAVTVNTLPVVGVVASPSSTVCSGSSVTLSGIGASIYSWSGGVTNGVSFVPSSMITFSVTGTGANGCTNTDTITVTVNPLPSVGATASPSAAVCSGSSVTLSGTGATSYNWSGGVNNGVAFIPSGLSTYTVTGTDTNGCTNFNVITITVNPSPNIIIQPTDEVVRVDSNALFITSSVAGASLQWQQDTGSGFANLINTGNYSGVTTDTLKITAVTLSQNKYKFRCIATLGSCSDSTNAALLTVTTDIAVIDQVLESGFSVYPNPAQDKLYVLLKGNPESQYILRLIDITGAIIITRFSQTEHSSNVIELDVSNLAKGIYILSFNTKNGTENAKVVLQ